MDLLNYSKSIIGTTPLIVPDFQINCDFVDNWQVVHSIDCKFSDLVSEITPEQASEIISEMIDKIINKKATEWQQQ